MFRSQVWLLAELNRSILPLPNDEKSRLVLHVSKLPLHKLKDVLREGQGLVPHNKGVGAFPDLVLSNTLSESIRFQVQHVLPTLYSDVPNSEMNKIFRASTGTFRDFLFRPGLGLLLPREAGVMRIHPRMWRTLCINHCYHVLKFNDGQLDALAFQMMHTRDVQRSHYIMLIVEDIARVMADTFDVYNSRA